jgi:hypothetical protein
MTRSQYRHGRTLDALEVRGAVYIPVEDVREGDTIIHLDHRKDFEVAGWEPSDLGVLLLGTIGESLDCYPGEFVAAIREAK